MPTPLDLTGKRFGRLTVVERSSEKRKRRGTFWVCKCDCGNVVVVPRCHLIDGHTKSCGCYHKDRLHEPRPSVSKHYLSKSRIYRIWSGMMDRTTNPNSRSYKNYMGRGIDICDEWKEFNNFKDWAFSHGYDDTLTIDRIDVNGNYEPSNCRWVDNRTQSRNKRGTLYVTRKGETKPLIDWCEIEGINYNRVHQRITAGWTPEKALSTKVRNRRHAK